MTPNTSKSFQNSINKTYAGQNELWLGEKFLKNYNYDLVSKLMRTSNGENSVLEFGAGLGTLSEIWAKRTGVTPDCFEVDVELVEILKKRGFQCFESYESINKFYDLIYSSNVLEHIEDDLTVLKELFSLTADGGQLVIYVPAFQCIYSGLDKKVGHYRRYDKNDLLDKLRSAGFVIDKWQYSDSLGFFVWLLTKLTHDTESETSIKKMRIYDHYIYPISKLFDAVGLRFIFGKNLLVNCKKNVCK
jgi:SAM-dependent methyltransferase